MQEKSAIDFVIATYGASEFISKLVIDEAGDLKMRSQKSESDHNTICIDVCLEKKSRCATKTLQVEYQCISRGVGPIQRRACQAKVCSNRNNE